MKKQKNREKKRARFLVWLSIAPIAGVLALVLTLLLEAHESTNWRNCFFSKDVVVHHALDLAQETIKDENIEQLSLLASSNAPWSGGFSVSYSRGIDAILSPDERVIVISGVLSYWDSRGSGSYWYNSVAIWEVNKTDEPLCDLIPYQGPRHLVAKGISADNRYVLLDQFGDEDFLGDCKFVTCSIVFDRVRKNEQRYTAESDQRFADRQDDPRRHILFADGNHRVCAHERSADALLSTIARRLDERECLTDMLFSSDRRLVFVSIEEKIEGATYGRVEIWGIVNE